MTIYATIFVSHEMSFKSFLDIYTCCIRDDIFDWAKRSPNQLFNLAYEIENEIGNSTMELLTKGK